MCPPPVSYSSDDKLHPYPTAASRSTGGALWGLRDFCPRNALYYTIVLYHANMCFGVCFNLLLYTIYVCNDDYNVKNMM